MARVAYEYLPGVVATPRRLPHARPEAARVPARSRVRGEDSAVLRATAHLAAPPGRRRASRGHHGCFTNDRARRSDRPPGTSQAQEGTHLRVRITEWANPEVELDQPTTRGSRAKARTDLWERKPWSRHSQPDGLVGPPSSPHADRVVAPARPRLPGRRAAGAGAAPLRRGRSRLRSARPRRAAGRRGRRRARGAVGARVPARPQPARHRAARADPAHRPR